MAEQIEVLRPDKNGTKLQWQAWHINSAVRDARLLDDEELEAWFADDRTELSDLSVLEWCGFKAELDGRELGIKLYYGGVAQYDEVDTSHNHEVRPKLTSPDTLINELIETAGGPLSEAALHEARYNFRLVNTEI